MVTSSKFYVKILPFCSTKLNPIFAKLFMKKIFFLLFCFAIIFESCVSNSKYNEASAHVEKLKSDSVLLAKRNRMLSEEKSYLENKSASIEQSLYQRLQEKQDSLNHKEELLHQHELSINDMKARKAEEREAFETLSKSVFELFNDLSSNDVHLSTNCTQISVEVSDRLLFVSGSIKIDAKSAKILEKVAAALSKNADLNLVIVAHTDSINSIKEKYDDNWTLGTLKANSILRNLIRDYKIQPAKISSSSRAETIALKKANQSLGRNRIEFVFYSSFLPCIHTKD
jgi:chemotaxis protein MotB